MTGIPMVLIDGVLLVTLEDQLLDQAVLALRDGLAQRMADACARGLILDVSAIDVIDSFLARALHDAAAVASLMAAETVVVGMRPAVAITLVELGLTLPGLATALSVDEGLALIGARGRVDSAGAR